MDDPRFKHVATDPRFKAIPKKSRKVTIDSRFQSMFTGDQFKIKYKVDKRGRKVNQSSNEDLRKYYELEGAEVGRSGTEGKLEVEVSGEKNVATDILSSGSSGGHVVEEVGRKGSNVRKEGVKSISYDYELSSEEEGEGEDVSSVSEQEEESSSDDMCFSGDQDSSTEALEGWRDEKENVATADETSSRFAVCNMDWDHLEARDIYVLLSSFKPAGSSILSVAIYPSDFGLERISQEDVEGPVGLVGVTQGEELPRKQKASTSEEGRTYSKEKLRQYQLSRHKYYYAVVECDAKDTAEHIYEQCNELEYEHSSSQLDLRFIPDDMKFDDRQPTSVAKGNLVTSDYSPTEFVSSALQQSKVKLTWDETNPHRLKLTQRKFTKDDLQSMDFSAYLASSSSSDGEGESSGRDKGECYKALLKEDGDGEEDKESDSVNVEEMEVTWEYGLKASAEDLVKKTKKEKDLKVESPWEKYLKKKKEKRKEAKRQRIGRAEHEEEEEGGREGDSGFDDPFFQHSVTTATARTTKGKKGTRNKVLSEEELQGKRELELLVMSDEEGEGRQHFNLPSILRSEKDSNKKKKRKRIKEKEEEQMADNFKVDVADDRFKALYESHLYAPDPSAPQYRATKGMGDIMEERRKRVKKSLKPSPSTSSTSSDPSFQSLVKSVKAKTASFQANKRKLTSKVTKRKISGLSN